MNKKKIKKQPHVLNLCPPLFRRIFFVVPRFFLFFCENENEIPLQNTRSDVRDITSIANLDQLVGAGKMGGARPIANKTSLRKGNIPPPEAALALIAAKKTRRSDDDAQDWDQDWDRVSSSFFLFFF